MRKIIAYRAAREINNGDIVNLGIGLPTCVPNYIPEGITTYIHSENGLVGMGGEPEDHLRDPKMRDAGNGYVTADMGAATFDTAMSFGIIRGGHLDITILGALQVDEEGNLANWMIPGKKVGMGGAMDLVVGAKKVIIAMEHTSKGKVKIVKSCTLPLTARGRVSMIITEKAVIEVTSNGLVLKEVSPYSSVEDIRATTEAELIIPLDLKTMELPEGFIENKS